MATIQYFGNTFENSEGYFEDAFGDTDSILSASSTQIVFLDAVSGFITTLTGTNLDAVTNPDLPTGTLTGFSTVDASNNLVVTMTGISWDLATYVLAVVSLMEDDDEAPLNALYSLQPLTLDSSASVGQVEFTLEDVTSSVSLIGSQFQDTLQGGANNDYIQPGGSDNGELILGSGGSDTIDFSQHNFDAWAELGYYTLSGPVVVDIDGPTNTGSVSKSGVGTDTIFDVNNVLQGDGLTIGGTSGDDIFNLDGGEYSWMQAAGGAGSDTFNLTLTDIIRLSFRFGAGTQTGNGAIIDLATGVVSDDGYGSQDQINVTDNGGRLELEATHYNDSITGSDADERFILQGGTDTLDGGGGYDRLRYDRSGVEDGITVNLGTGVITGVWYGEDFTHFVSGIERVDGSDDGNDLMLGSSGGDRFNGYGGNDTLRGLDGTDSLYGGYGDDLLDPGSNTNYDLVDAGSGTDIIDAGSMATGYLYVQHYDLNSVSGQVFNINGITNTAVITKGAYGSTTILDVRNPMDLDGLGLEGSGQDDVFNLTVSDDGRLVINGGGGNDTYNLGASYGGIRMDFRRDTWGYDATEALDIDLSTGQVANDGTGAQDVITGIGNVALEIRGTTHADRMTGSIYDDRFITYGGDDTIDGGDGFDVVRFDRSRMSSGVEVDLAAGTAEGIWDGTEFTVSLSNIEEIWGTDYYDDLMFGSSAAETLWGSGGDDVLLGGGFQTSYATDVANQVFRLYRATLDRDPDNAGHKSWTMRLGEDRTLTEVAGGFVGSAEFQATYGLNQSSTDFVQLLYQNVLDRAADAGGLANWVGKLDNNERTRAEVVLGFSESAEFINATLAEALTFARDSDPASWSDDVYRLYQATLARSPDEGGWMGWTEKLGDGTRTLDEVSAGFVGSAEFQATYGPNLNSTDFVELLYQNVLGRAADSGGLANWTGQLASGTSRAEVVLGFSQSSEFITNTTTALTDWVRGLGTDDELIGGTGENYLAGGRLSDVFVFDADKGATDVVLDFEAWDELEFLDFGYGTAADARAHMSQSGSDVVFSDQGVTITLEDTTLALFNDDDIFLI